MSDGRAYVSSLPDVSRETLAQLDRYVELLTAANANQNLVAAATLAPDILWQRHIADSAQLSAIAARHDVAGGRWADLGSGPGLPGLIVAIVNPRFHVTLVESRRLRCEFLADAIAELGLSERVALLPVRVEAVSAPAFDVISARAFAPLMRLLPLARHLASPASLWVLPKGRNAVNELSTIEASWQTRFHVEPSVTDADAAIIVGRGLGARRRGKSR